MFWADRIVEDIQKRYGAKSILIRDEKTASGRVHVGSMRGVAIHGIISEILEERGTPHSFIYEINDFDPMDDLPVYLPKEKFQEHLGKPLCRVPSPDDSAKNYAEYFGQEFERVIRNAGWNPQFTRASDLYVSGKMDDVIREALENATDIRHIYKEVSGSQRDENWLPINVICPQCGKMTTTRADEFDGEVVHFVCRENAVEYTRGCGYEGHISPFGGNAKLPWKVEWPAKWRVYGVDVEGGGKDHSTRGGSRDVANHISSDVFHREPPFDVPYEFFLVGGRKMSSSKGHGSSAKEISELLPPKIFRLALLSKDINQQINFDPEGDTIPVLYDLYDKLAEGYKQGERDDYARLFILAHPAETRKELVLPFLPRFSQVAFLVQMPHLNLEEEVAKMKGEPLQEIDRRELEERAAYARRWLDTYAPEKFVFKLQEQLPDTARSLTEGQKRALRAIADRMRDTAILSGEELHHFLHGLKDELGISPQELFSAIYLAILGKSYGPKAGWFLSVLPKDFLLKRLTEAAA